MDGKTSAGERLREVACEHRLCRRTSHTRVNTDTFHRRFVLHQSFTQKEGKTRVRFRHACPGSRLHLRTVKVLSAWRGKGDGLGFFFRILTEVNVSCIPTQSKPNEQQSQMESFISESRCLLHLD